ncbi:MAG: ThuA domain-containing protein [Pseudomonadota bacterium]
MALNVLVISKGHPFAHDAFIAMFEALEGVTMTLVEHPAAHAVLQPDAVARYDVVFFYDMSGIPGVGLTHDDADAEGNPPDGYRTAIEHLVQSGKGLMLVNHATVGWPNWPLWRQISGSSFMLRTGQLNGETVPGSGYRGAHGPLPNATIKVLPQGSHPVLEGLDDGFEITDELYLKTPGFEANVVPLLRGDYDFVVSNFSPPPLAPPDEQAAWDHPPGSNLLVWANACGRSPIVVSELGDSPLAYENPGYRRLLGNALRWLVSEEARQWAAQSG